MRYTQRAALLLAIMGLTACATQGPIKAYEGQTRAPNELALLSIPEQVEVMAVDGHEPPPSFLKSNVELNMLPGEHVLSLRYVELFQLGSDEHDVVRSKQAALRFTAVAGTAYTLQAPKQLNHAAAKAFAKDPHFTVLDKQSGAITESTAIKSYAEASLMDSISKAFSDSQAAASTVTNLDLLKDVWARTSSEERSAFRAWLDQTGK